MAYNKNDFLAGVVAGRALHGRHIGANGAPIRVEGNLNITENGDYDVTKYKTATVNIPGKTYTLNEILAGTSFYPVWVNAWVTCYPEYIINSADDNSISWTFRFRSSGLYHPQTADELVGIALPPYSLEIPGGESPRRIIKLPDLAGTYFGEYTTGGASAEEMKGCGIRIESINSGFISAKPANTGGMHPIWPKDTMLGLASTECYAVYVTGDGWKRPDTYMNFTMDIPFTTPVEGGAWLD